MCKIEAVEIKCHIALVWKKQQWPKTIAGLEPLLVRHRAGHVALVLNAW
jgi:hypothetical protein